MLVSSTEFKVNLGKYLDIAANEDIIITRNGRKIAKLVKAEDDTLSEIRSLFGILASRVSDHLSQSTCLEMLHPETGKHRNPSVEVHHIVGELSAAESLLSCNVKFLVINVCNHGKTLCSPCILASSDRPYTLNLHKIYIQGVSGGICHASLEAILHEITAV
jgi:prevent-host-death family protein